MRVRSFALLILGLLTYYLAVVFTTGFFSDPEALLLRMAPDSAEYVAVADWLFHGTSGEMIERRSYFYPLVLGLARLPFGNLGIWVLQMGFWLSSAVIFYVNLGDLVRSQKWRAFLLGLFCLAWTPILLSLVALTETLALFLFSLVSLCLVHYFKRKPAHVIYPITLFLAGVLAAVKPNYSPLLYGSLLLVGMAKCANRVVMSWATLGAAVALALLPTGVQVVLHYEATGTAATSNIGHHVLQVSLYSQVLAKVEKADFMSVRERVIAENPTMNSMAALLAEHPWITIGSVLHNLEENIRTVLHITSPENPVEHFFRKKLNDVFYWLHMLFILPLGWTLWRIRSLREPGDLALALLALFFILGLLPTGISFWAADRWTAPLLPVWPLLYLMVAQRIQEFRRLKALRG